jgi:hypothetical protein
MQHGAKQYRQFNGRARMVLQEPSIGKQTKLRNKRKTEQRNEQNIFVAETDNVVVFRGHTVQRTKTAAHRQRRVHFESLVIDVTKTRTTRDVAAPTGCDGGCVGVVAHTERRRGATYQQNRRGHKRMRAET